MEDQVKKEQDEYWIDYIIRRLQMDGYQGLDNFFNGARWKLNFVEGKSPINDLSTNLYGGISLFRDIAENEKEGIVISLQRDFLDIQETLRKRRSIKIIDCVSLNDKLSEESIYFDFTLENENVDVNCSWLDSGEDEIGESLVERSKLIKKYRDGYYSDESNIIRDCTYIAEDILNYIKESNIKPSPIPENYSADFTLQEFSKLEFRYDKLSNVHNQSEGKAQESKLSQIAQLEKPIEEILRSIRKLERIAAEHPIILKSYEVHLQELYVRAINQDISNLRFFEYKRKNIPYVLVDSSDLYGTAGRVFFNLYLVAKDKAPEEWQQKIIAYHESLCARIGHEKAKRKELSLAKDLGKEKEYKQWRKLIDKEFRDSN